MQTKKLIVVEACDGCGKTTLVNNLCKLFEKRDGFKPVCVKEPWEGSKIGTFIRSWIKHVDFSTSELKKEQALLLFSAARLEMLEQFLLKELVRKDDNDSPLILCDRFVLSTCVYQNLKSEDPLRLPMLTQAILSTIADLLKVDCTLYLDLDAEVIVDRLNKRKEKSDVMDQKDATWFNQLSGTYNHQIQILQHNYPTLLGMLHYLDASKYAEVVAEDAYAFLKRHILKN